MSKINFLKAIEGRYFFMMIINLDKLISLRKKIFIFVFLFLLIFSFYFYSIYKISPNSLNVSNLETYYTINHNYKFALIERYKNNFMIYLISIWFLYIITIYNQNNKVNYIQKQYLNFVLFIKKRFLLIPRFNRSKYKDFSSFILSTF